MYMQNYVRNLIDFKTSVVGGLRTFDRIAAQLEAGDNVIMLANHQTEADPGGLKALSLSDVSSDGEWRRWMMAEGLHALGTGVGHFP